MLEQGSGAIVNTGSIASERGLPGDGRLQRRQARCPRHDAHRSGRGRREGHSQSTPSFPESSTRDCFARSSRRWPARIVDAAVKLIASIAPIGRAAQPEEIAAGRDLPRLRCGQLRERRRLARRWWRARSHLQSHDGSGRCRCRTLQPLSSDVRRDRRRCGFCGSVRAPPPAPTRIERAGLRVGPERRRHLVLELLPGSAVRRRERRLLLLVLGRAPAGVVVERALSRPARAAPLPEPRRRPLRPPQGHSARDDRHRRRLRRGERPLDGDDFRWRRSQRRVLRDGDWLPLDVADPDLTGLDSFERGVVPHRRLAAGGRRLSPASGSE